MKFTKNVKERSTIYSIDGSFGRDMYSFFNEGREKETAAYFETVVKQATENNYVDKVHAHFYEWKETREDYSVDLVND